MMNLPRVVLQWAAPLLALIGCGKPPSEIVGPNGEPPSGIRISAQGTESVSTIIGNITSWLWRPFTDGRYTVYPFYNVDFWCADNTGRPILDVTVNDAALGYVKCDTTGIYFRCVPHPDGSVDVLTPNRDDLCAINLQVWDNAGHLLSGFGYQASWNNYMVLPANGFTTWMLPESDPPSMGAYVFVDQPDGWDVVANPWWATVNGDTLRYVTEHRGPFTFYFYLLKQTCAIRNPAINWPMEIDID